MHGYWTFSHKEKHKKYYGNQAFAWWNDIGFQVDNKKWQWLKITHELSSNTCLNDLVNQKEYFYLELRTFIMKVENIIKIWRSVQFVIFAKLN